MSRAANRRQAGFTFFEIVVGMVLVLAGVSAFGAVMSSTDRLSKESQLHTNVAREHRRNLHAIANYLSGAWIESLDGFDVSGTARVCAFQRVIDQDASGPVYGPVEIVRWVVNKDVPQVNGKPVGRVVLLDGNGGTRVLADRVPQDTFFVRQEGRNLVVHLSTYYRTSVDQVVQVTGDTSVTLRN